MFSRCSLAISRSVVPVSRRRILSAAFSLDKEWASRHAEFAKLGLGGDYEWIGAIQKKFIGGGIASAIDVDAAVCIAEHKDQVSDVIDLVYKLRHSENAADLPASAEYALIRLLLKHDPSFIFTLANDTINYGIFPNEHSACLAIDHFIKSGDISGAARLSAWVMQQEMTTNELLNLLGIYSCVKWAELPTEEKSMPMDEREEEEVGEDDMKTFKFPYLKNPHFDSHFDLKDPAYLAGKSLLWLARDSHSLSESLRDSVKLLGALLYNRLDIAETLACSSIHGSVAEIVQTQLTPPEGVDPDGQHLRIMDKLANCQTAEKPISDVILSHLNEIRESEELSLASKQIEEFAYWNKRRHELIKAQADRVLLKIRAEEITKELAELEDQSEKLFFFENRLKWEKKAAENEEINVEMSNK